MYPVKRSYPVKGSTPATSSTLYPVKKAGNLNQHSQSSSDASATRVQSYGTSLSQTYGDRHAQQETNNPTCENIHEDQDNRVEKLQEIDKLSSPQSKADPLSSPLPQLNILSGHQTNVNLTPNRELSEGVDPDGQSLRKPSAGDPSSLSFIPGLTIHLPPPFKVKRDDLMTLFESCSRSKKRLTVDTAMGGEAIGPGRHILKSKIFIQDKYICTGSGWSSRKSRNDAATKALDFLCKFQPCRCNTRREMMLSPRGDRIQGLTLGMTSAKPTKEECLDVIMDSCIDSNLPVTWWDDCGGKVFGDGRGTVLLINGKPICWGLGEDLDDAMKETALRAIQVLQHRHLPGEMGGKGKAKRKVSAAESGELESPSKKQKIIDISELSDDALSSVKVPNLTIYTTKGKTSSPLSALLESFFRSDVTAKMDCTYAKGSGQYEAKLSIKDELSNTTFLCTGIGKGTKEARTDVAQKMLNVLQKSHPCVYKTRAERQYRSGQIIKGFKIYLTSEEEDKEHALSQLTSSCEKCKIPLSWWHDSGGSFYGYKWTTVLVINSKPICWGHGVTLDAAKISAAVTALERLQEAHPVVRGNEANEEEEASKKEPVTSSNDLAANTGEDMDGEEYLKTAIPGLTIYVSVQNDVGTGNSKSDGHRQNRHAKSTILRSVNRCNMKVSVQDVPPEKVVKKNLGQASNLLIGDVLVACGYGKTYLEAQWAAWKVSFDTLIRLQAVVYEPNAGKSSPKTVPEINESVKPVGMSEQDYIKEKLKDSAAIVTSLASPHIEFYSDFASVKPVKFTVDSQWVDRKAQPSELEMNENSDELIGKYLQIYRTRVS